MTRNELVIELLRIKEIALKAERSGVSKSGEPWSYAQPDIRGAVECLKLVGELCGYLGTRRMHDIELATAESELLMGRYASSSSGEN